MMNDDKKNVSSFSQMVKAMANNSKSSNTQNLKTPAGYIRYTDGNVYPLQNVEVNANLYCNNCNTDNMRLLGYIVVDTKIYYITKCPWHPQNIKFIEESVLRKKYPHIFPGKHLMNSHNPYNPNYPVQRSYCKHCRGTTAEVIGEIEYENCSKWIVRCTEDGCGMSWNEEKVHFAEKYIGTADNPPLYKQVPPKGPYKYNGPNFFRPAKILSFKDEKEEKDNKIINEQAKNTESFIDVQGILFKVPENMKAHIEFINGQTIISFK